MSGWRNQQLADKNIQFSNPDHINVFSIHQHPKARALAGGGGGGLRIGYPPTGSFKKVRSSKTAFRVFLKQFKRIQGSQK